MPKMYLVAVRWVDSRLEPQRVDLALSPMGDWFRYNPMTWFVWTDWRTGAIARELRSSLGGNDSVVVMRVDPSDLDGIAPTQTWQWLQSKAPRNALADMLSRQ